MIAHLVASMQGKVVPGVSSQEIEHQQIPGRRMFSTPGAEAALSLTTPSKRGAEEKSFTSDRCVSGAIRCR